MRQTLIHRMIQILSQDGYRTTVDLGRYGYVKEFIASEVLHQDISTKAGRKFLKNIDLLTFDYNAMILQDDMLVRVFEIVCIKSGQPR